METIISLNNVSKEFRIFNREKTLKSSVKSIFSRRYSIKNAVDDLSFSINKGELVGYIGSNGAGKSTTIKMLTGILVPTRGEILVRGSAPYKNRRENAKNIGVVFGQRTQLFWNLPMEETFDLYKKMYNINDKVFRENVAYFTELLDMKPFIRTPVRQLSLGQRMRAELVVSLLHNPEILYLDEPTIGLDVVVKQKIRDFIREINRDKRTTVILTTHDMEDIQQMCDRIILIDNGKLIFDGETYQFIEKYNEGNIVLVESDNEIKLFDSRLKLMRVENHKKWILYNKKEISTAKAIANIVEYNSITDIKIIEPSVEDAVKNFYEFGNAQV